MDLGKALDQVPKKVLVWIIRKKGIPEVLVRSVKSLYEIIKIKVRLGSELSEKFEVKVGISPRICAVTFSFCNRGRYYH